MGALRFGQRLFAILFQIGVEPAPDRLSIQSGAYSIWSETCADQASVPNRIRPRHRRAGSVPLHDRHRQPGHRDHTLDQPNARSAADLNRHVGRCGRPPHDRYSRTGRGCLRRSVDSRPRRSGAGSLAVGAEGILGLDSRLDFRVLLDFREKTIAMQNIADRRALRRGHEIALCAWARPGQLLIADAIIEGVRATVIMIPARGAVSEVEALGVNNTPLVIFACSTWWRSISPSARCCSTSRPPWPGRYAVEESRAACARDADRLALP